MFAKGDAVEVYFIHPGSFEPRWHRGVIVKQVDQSASFVVDVGGIETQATPANIRKV